jgi:hypothetical protein
MANILTGSYGNANEQVFYGKADVPMESAQMIFPNGAMGTIGGGEFVPVTKYMTGLFGEKYPYVVTEFVPNQPVKMAMANEKVMANIAYSGDDGSVMKSGVGMIGLGAMNSGMGVVDNAGANGGWSGNIMKPKSCPNGWTDTGVSCFEPITQSCDRGTLQGGLCMENGSFGFPMPVGVPVMKGGSVMSKW